MLDIVLSNQFKKDIKLAAKRGYDINLLDEIVTKLANREALAEKYRDHSLTGKYSGFRECHLQPDWLLIYRIEENALLLFLSRTGSHSDLF
ncbi:MAG: type II toxin-antitoxin system YafQ family toxin [Clostridiales bacterium]|nr:type II toxin-antitoxin system YafQ family toxin [Clostridiales bacterium]